MRRSGNPVGFYGSSAVGALAVCVYGVIIGKLLIALICLGLVVLCAGLLLLRIRGN